MAKNFLLPCKNCDNKISITVSQAGEVVVCPSCQASTQVPTLREVNRLEVAESVVSIAPDRREASQTAWRGLRGLALAACLAVSLIFLARTGYFGWARSTVDTRGTKEEMLESLSKVVDRKEVPELMGDWFQSLMFTLEEENRNPPQFFVNQKYAKYFEERIWFSAIVSTISLVGAGLVLFAWPKPQNRR